jgi:hypothetical protein
VPEVVERQRVASPLGPRWLRRTLAVFAVLYALTILLDASGARTYKVVPRPLLYFAQIAALFPDEAKMAIEFRVEGFLCADGKYHEIDERPLFAIHRDDKENKFFRAMSFYFDTETKHSKYTKLNHMVLTALADYIVRGYDRDPDASPIGGAMLLSLRERIPKPGEKFPRFTRTPLESHPTDEHKVWFITPPLAAQKRCAEIGHPVPKELQIEP